MCKNYCTIKKTYKYNKISRALPHSVLFVAWQSDWQGNHTEACYSNQLYLQRTHELVSLWPHMINIPNRPNIMQVEKCRAASLSKIHTHSKIGIEV